MQDPDFTRNRFLNNGTGVSLIRVPGTVVFNFSNPVFSGNDVDIDNPYEQPVNTEKSVFQ